jgi:hypothetical protein
VAVDPSVLSNFSRPPSAVPGLPAEGWEPDDDAAEIRFSLTALGEALVAERRGRPFRGFGPCAAASREAGPGGAREASRR